MSGVDRVVSLLQDDHRTVHQGQDAEQALLELLVHMASSDGVIDDTEIEMLEGVLEGRVASDVRAFIGRVAAEELDLDDLASRLVTEDQRWTALRYAARMAHRDDTLDDSERTFLDDLAGALALDTDAVERVLREDATRTRERFDPEELRTMLEAISWGAADFADGGVASGDLVPHVPDDATPVLRVGVDQAEVLGFYAEGLVGRFLEGAAWIPWPSIVGFSRGTGLDASVRIHTDTGAVHSLVDPRLAGIQTLFDRMYRKLGERKKVEIIASARRHDTWDSELDEPE